MANAFLLLGEAGATAGTMTSGLTDMGSVVTTAFGIITGNAILMALFCASLLGAAFKIIKQGKKAAK